MSVYRSDTVQPGQPLIELHKVSQRYELQRARQRSLQEGFIQLLGRSRDERSAFWPLREVSFRIDPGESVGIIGPNGSGKSTLLKVLSGILTPTMGDLWINGRISSLLELGAGFHPELTGRDNIYLNGSIYGLSRKQMDRQLAAIIAYAELGDFIDTPVKHYSSGMYVRLGFAVAIHTAPDLLLVDEVLAVGDATFQRKCLTSIQRFRDRGGTLILVSHDLTVIQSICKRALWLDQGMLQADGHPTDVIMAYTQHLAEKEAATQAGQLPPDDEQEEPENDHAPAPIRRWGNGRIRITGVEFGDPGNRPRSHIATGEPLTITVHYVAGEPTPRPVFGLAIYHQNGAHICGPNTKFAQLPIPLAHGAGVVRYVIPALSLLEGSYTLSAAVVNESNTETYDYHDRLYEFQVYRGRSHELYGLVTLNGHWEIDPPPPAQAEYTPQRTVELH
jgi:lipopolysaccharide transport system ATP-binding protein